MTTHLMTIGGEPVSGESTFPVTDPATGAPFADAPECSPAQLDAALAAAAAALPAWRADVDARRAALLRCAAALQSRAAELAPLLTREQGKPLAKATREILGAAAWFGAFAEMELGVEVLRDDGRSRVELHRRPLGVVAAITPWNYPVILAVWKLAPALLAGNTVVVKPSPYTPLSTLALGRVLADVLPPGVVSVVSGGDALGARLTAHRTVRKISFTGSVPTGKKIWSSAAPDLKRVTLELGGNDAAIVLDDVDPERVARRLFWGAFENGGQLCVAIKRLYVHERIHDQVVDAVAAFARTVRVGNGMEDDVQIGPVNNRPQLARIRGLVDGAVAAGATLHASEAPAGPGFFFAPTLVTGVAEGVPLVDEEQFGPVVPIMPFASVDEAVDRANATSFGLGGLRVWTDDLDRGADIAARLDCGTSWVNQHNAMGPDIPFGGCKWSGVGTENGRWGLEEFTQKQVINVRRES